MLSKATSSPDTEVEPPSHDRVSGHSPSLSVDEENELFLGLLRSAKTNTDGANKPIVSDQPISFESEMCLKVVQELVYPTEPEENLLKPSECGEGTGRSVEFETEVDQESIGEKKNLIDFEQDKTKKEDDESSIEEVRGHFLILFNFIFNLKLVRMNKQSSMS